MARKITNTGIAAFDDGAMASHSTLQSEVAGASTQAAKDTATRAHFNRMIALANASGANAAIYIQGLKDVGTKA